MSKKNKRKHIYWFAYYNLESPSVRYRAYYPLQFAGKNLGISSDFVIPGYSPKKIVTFVKAYLSAFFFPKRNSLIVIQRVRSNFIYANLLKLLVFFQKKRTVYDLDDADYLEGKADTIYFFVRNCMYISAGSHEIQEYLQKYNKNSYHISSPVPDLGIVKEKRNNTFTIGWIGGYHWGHKKSLYEHAFPAIRKIPFPCKFVLLGVVKKEDQNEIEQYFSTQQNLKLEMPRIDDWTDETLIQKTIASFDVGIATLEDSIFHRSKSGIKAKQYLNNGVPVLCNDVPENNKVVKHGKNGYICKDSSDFYAHIDSIKNMSENQYKILTKHARDSVVPYHYNAYFKLWNQMMKIK